MKIVAEIVKLYIQGGSIERQMRETPVGQSVETGVLVRGLRWFGGRWSLGFKFSRDA